VPGASPLAAAAAGVLDEDPDEAAVTDALLDTVDLAEDLRPLLDALEHATSAGTRRAYATDWADFADWAGRHRLATLPAEPRTVALYVTAAQDRLHPATLLRRLSAIAVAHRTAGHPSPTGHELVRRVITGLRRKHGARPAGKTALVPPRSSRSAAGCTSSRPRPRSSPPPRPRRTVDRALPHSAAAWQAGCAPPTLRPCGLAATGRCCSSGTPRCAAASSSRSTRETWSKPNRAACRHDGELRHRIGRVAQVDLDRVG